MPKRSRRASIDSGIQDRGQAWEESYYYTPFPADYVQFFLPFNLVPGDEQTSILTLWDKGVVSLGRATLAQISFMQSGQNPFADPDDGNAGFPGEFFLIDFSEGAPISSTFSMAFGLVDFDAPYLLSQAIPTAFFEFEEFSNQLIIVENGFTLLIENTNLVGYKLGNTVWQRTPDSTSNEIEIDGLEGFFVFDGTAGQDVLRGTEFNDTIFGLGGPDTLLGLSGKDTLDGGDGNDALDGGPGDDVLLGGIGDDEIFGRAGHDTIDGGAGADFMDGGGGYNTLSYASEVSSGVVVNLSTNTASGGSATGDVIINFWNVIGGSRADHLTGTNGANILSGGPGTDTLYGLGGNDTLDGGANADSLFGGDGRDYLIGGYANDLIDGGAGIDTADYRGFGGGIAVNLSTAGPQDTGAAGVDTLIDVENLVGGDFNDRFVGRGGTSANTLDGGKGADQLFGLGGNDMLLGGEGNDKLQGGAGDDILVGGSGRDILVGGDGRDIFDFDDPGDSVVGGQRDRINDFVQGEDLIDLTDIDAIFDVPGIQSFSFIDNAAFSGQGGEIRWRAAPLRTIIEGDIDGDRIADFEIEIYSELVLTENDFLLFGGNAQPAEILMQDPPAAAAIFETESVADIGPATALWVLAVGLNATGDPMAHHEHLA